MWTQQSGGCGQPGDQIYLGYKALETADSNLGHGLVKEFAMYRYGVFEEQGYKNDPIYPICFHDKDDNVQVNGCSDFPIKDNGICSEGSAVYNITEMVDPKARTSIMFAAESPSVSMFCDSGNHDSYAPTKHNLICGRRNTYDVILQHPDFHTQESSEHSETNIDLSAKITYKRHTTTRYVFVIENTKNMAVRESWTFLRSAIRKWVQFDLPENSEVGLVLTNETNAYVASGLTSLKDTDKNIIASALPYFTADTSQTPCLNCAITVALDMFKNLTTPGSNVIIVIAPGINNGSQTLNILKKAKEDKVRIASINYPNVLRQSSLDFLSEYTNGISYSVIEKKQNVETSMISTYFQLSNALYNIIERFYAGNLNDIPLEIHRREIKNDRRSITGSFFMDENIGGPIKFILYTHNQTPLIRSITLTSPTQQTYTQRIDNLEVKIISLQPTTSENGTWTYTIEPFAGNPQPHFLQVVAKPLAITSNVVRSKFWLSRNQGPTVLYVEVKKGNNPIVSAKVEVRITKTEANGSSWHKETLQLFDTGSGDPDVTMNDGIYSRYHNAYVSGPGTYTYEVIVNDNGNTAYIFEEYPYNGKDDESTCCGSSISPSKKRIPVKPFERVLSPISVDLSSDEINTANQQPAGRILDLHVDVRAEDLKATLTWTAPDMGGHSVSSYEIRYARTIEDIADNFELKAQNLDMGDPLPLSIGSETNFNLDFSRQRGFLDKTIYLAVKATSKISLISTVSNFVRVHVKSPPPPPTVAPTYSTYDHSSWPGDGYNMVDTRPNMVNESGFGNEIIYGVVAVVIALILILGIYYCMCVKKKNQTTKAEALKSDKMNVTIAIDPNTPLNQANPQNCYSNQISDTDHTIGVPVTYPYDDEPKKRYSLVQQQEQQLIEELKQQHMNQNYSGLSVISNGSLHRNQPTLSPFNSWSASQLLHEHERRHSPLTDEQMMTHQEIIEHLDHMSLNGQNVDHVSLNHYITNGHIAPPVPPLPAFNGGYPVNYVYAGNQPIYQTRGEPFNQSLQGSMSSVNGAAEKKRRNVTMV